MSISKVQRLNETGVVAGSFLSANITVGVDGRVTAVSNGSFVPTGVIVMWSGSIASIPTGWSLCDGTNGTPDLRDRFVIGAGGAYDVTQTGGSANATLVSHTHSVTDPGHDHGVTDPGHSHGVTDPGHKHNFSGWTFNRDATEGQDGGNSAYAPVAPDTDTNVTGISIQGNGTGVSINSGSTGISIGSSGASGTNANLPPYFALAYIMKL